MKTEMSSDLKCWTYPEIYQELTGMIGLLCKVFRKQEYRICLFDELQDDSII
jgi:hypothetical protein